MAAKMVRGLYRGWHTVRAAVAGTVLPILVLPDLTGSTERSQYILRWSAVLDVVDGVEYVAAAGCEDAEALGDLGHDIFR